MDETKEKYQEFEKMIFEMIFEEMISPRKLLWGDPLSIVHL